MPGTTTWFVNGIKHALSDVDWLADPITVALTSSAYTPDQDAHEFFSSVTNELATGNGYTAGGQLLTGKTVTIDAATNQCRLKAGNPQWTTAVGQTLTARKAVIYKNTGTPATSPLLAVVDFGADKSASDGGSFAVAWDATTGALYVDTP